jgi:multicomponent Na+:H+ antiporter subunit G
MTVAALALVGAGTFFALVSAVGLYRLPDCYSRAHAASKTETLGTVLALSGAGLAFGGGRPVVKLVLLGTFVLVTSPVAAHAVIRSAHERGIEPWSRERER